MAERFGQCHSYYSHPWPASPNRRSCGAPSVLIKAGVLQGRNATIHPAGRKDLTDDQYVDDRVVVSGKLVTSKAAGTAM
ncbi:MAG TPA: DJ-1/PfpI family protein [Methanothrix sp.]|nr:DJ-1/PfpI family protein [Methanothrix sp.]